MKEIWKKITKALIKDCMKKLAQCRAVWSTTFLISEMVLRNRVRQLIWENMKAANYYIFKIFIVLKKKKKSSLFFSHRVICDPINCSTPCFPVLFYISELAQTHVHWAVMPSNHLILCRHLLLLASIFPSIRVISKESALSISWSKYWSFNFSINPSNGYSGLISLGLTGLISLLSKGLSRVYFSTTVQKHQFFRAQPYIFAALISIHDYWKYHIFDHMDLCWQSDVSAF